MGVLRVDLRRIREAPCELVQGGGLVAAASPIGALLQRAHAAIAGSTAARSSAAALQPAATYERAQAMPLKPQATAASA